MNLVFVSIAAGLASALLFAAVGTGSALAGVLSYLAPLPVLIVAMGWHQRAGLAAAVIAAAVLAVVLRPTTALAFGLGSGLPGWWIGYLALLGRPGAAPEGETEWYPIGRLLAWIAAVAAAITLVGALAIGQFDHDAYRRIVSGLIQAFLRMETGTGRDVPIPPLAGIPAERVVGLAVAAIPLLAGASFTLVFVINTWLAARIVSVSGRMARPWPYLPATRMPLVAVGATLGGLLATVTPGFVSVAGAALTGALGMAFALQGLAFVHAATTEKPWRGVLLGMLYVLTAVFGGTMLPLLSLVGIADSATPIRRRLALPFNRPN